MLLKPGINKEEVVFHMSRRPVENTLFIGNGFSRSVFRDVPSWGNLFEGVNNSIQDYTFLYEAFLLEKKRNGLSENLVKQKLVEKIKGTFSGKSVKENILDLERFGQLLSQYHVNNIITTNYDNGIEFILCEFCGYREQVPTGMVPERVYSIRTYSLFVNDDTRHYVKLWKIHGDLKRISSVTLGFDQYCGSLSKLSAYVKGNYSSSRKDARTSCKISMEQKCREQTFDNLSWAELFFRTNVYFVGFGLHPSEIDIWWLLNKRARLMIDIPQIENTITYLYNAEYEAPVKKTENRTAELDKARFATLDAFMVQ